MKKIRFDFHKNNHYIRAGWCILVNPDLYIIQEDVFAKLTGSSRIHIYYSQPHPDMKNGLLRSFVERSNNLGCWVYIHIPDDYPNLSRMVVDAIKPAEKLCYTLCTDRRGSKYEYHIGYDVCAKVNDTSDGSPEEWVEFDDLARTLQWEGKHVLICDQGLTKADKYVQFNTKLL